MNQNILEVQVELQQVAASPSCVTMPLGRCLQTQPLLQLTFLSLQDRGRLIQSMLDVSKWGVDGSFWGAALVPVSQV